MRSCGVSFVRLWPTTTTHARVEGGHMAVTRARLLVHGAGGAAEAPGDLGVGEGGGGW